MTRLLVVALLACSGCAMARVETEAGRRYVAVAIGASHAAAGKCDRVTSDETESTKDTETRIFKDDERGKLCAIAGGGHGSPGLWATVMAGFSALGILLAGAL